MNITNMYVPSWNKSRKETYPMKAEYIVVHNTYNSATAMAEASYMCGNSNWTSFHDVVDEYRIVHCIDHNRNAWHCGAVYGNRHSIGIEIARSTASKDLFLNSEKNAAEYVAYLLKKYNWGIDKVKTHQSQSGKYCPHKTLDLGWNRFINMVKNYLNGKESSNYGWIHDSNGWWFKNKDGSYPKSGFAKIYDHWFYFNDKGYMLTGWIKHNNNWFYMNQNGIMHIGWLKYNNNWFYFNSKGYMLTGEHKIDGKTYLFNDKGYLKS